MKDVKSYIEVNKDRFLDELLNLIELIINIIIWKT